MLMIFPPDIRQQHLTTVTRRQFFGRCATGIGSVALASLLNEKLFAATVSSANPLAPGAPHFAPKAKRAIYLHMGEPYEVEELDLTGRRALVRAAEGDYYTQPKVETATFIEEVKVTWWPARIA